MISMLLPISKPNKSLCLLFVAREMVVVYLSKSSDVVCLTRTVWTSTVSCLSLDLIQIGCLHASHTSRLVFFAGSTSTIALHLIISNYVTGAFVFPH